PEARMLLEAAGRATVEVRGVEDFETVGRAVLELGPHWVLVKGGHAPLTKDYKVAETEEEKSIVVDVLARDLVNVLREAKQEIDPRLAEMTRFGGGGGGGRYGGWRGGRGGGRANANSQPMGNRRW
ncbi:hypothetical protein BN1708_018095, partial [Verticillium longisporum]